MSNITHVLLMHNTYVKQMCYFHVLNMCLTCIKRMWTFFPCTHDTVIMVLVYIAEIAEIPYVTVNTL